MTVYRRYIYCKWCSVKKYVSYKVKYWWKQWNMGQLRTALPLFWFSRRRINENRLENCYI